MNPTRVQEFVDRRWDDSILPELVRYIRIPNKSPAFDRDWDRHGHMDEAVDLVAAWCREQPIDGMRVDVERLPGRTPLVLIDVPGASERPVLLYGHLDKQPEMEGWREGLGPWDPVLEDERLYGRGGADDGYAVYAALTAIRALREEGRPHPRCVVVIEACEESGSYDLPFYMGALADRIGSPELVVCLDSGCGNYEQLWCTTSLRGMVGGVLTVEVLSEGVHSGDAGGVVPSSFRVLRRVLSRLEDEETGRILDPGFAVEIPEARVAQAARAAGVLGDEVYRKFPFHGTTGPVTTDGTDLVLNRTWRASLAVTGAAGLPGLADAGNVLRPATAVKLSLRLPPILDADAAAARLRTLLEASPPHGAAVRFEPDIAARGWNAPEVAVWLEQAVDEASRTYFGKEAVFMGEGGTIPFMAMLGEQFPEAQFLITGVLGPHSNAHGPNEFLHLPTAKRITACVAHVLSAYLRRA